MSSLAGKRILVTGASGALGSRIATLLASHGARLVLSGRNAQALQALGVTEEMFTVDLSVPGAASSLIRTVTASEPLDGIVLAHGVVAFGSVADLDTPTLLSLTQINYNSVAEFLAAASPALHASAEAGHDPFVVTISGVISDMPTAGMAAYGASKSALKSLVTAVQREWRREGIRVLDTRPPHTETGLAGRAIAGTAPAFPQGLDGDVVAARIVQAILDDEKDVPTDAFGA
jgi:cyclic-di-GMP-binding biofilm dispersal mediator protein